MTERQSGIEAWFEAGLGAEPAELSEAGRRRRDAMRERLRAAVVARRRRRGAARWAAGALAAAVLAALVWRAAPGVGPGTETAPGHDGAIAQHPAAPQPEAPQPDALPTVLRHAAFGVVRDDASALERYAARSAPLSPAIWIDDRQLVALLAAADRRTGLIRTPDRVVLTADVVDAVGE